MSNVRASVEEFAVHGGRLDLARAAFPEVADWTDLSTGISPWAYPATAVDATLRALPSPSVLAGLEAAAAAMFGSDPALTVAVPGSDLGLRLVARLLGHLGNTRVAVVGPGYSGHVAMWLDVPVTEVTADTIPPAGDHGVLVLARPNNPDGVIVDAAVLMARPGWLIVDEAFVDTTPGDSLANKVLPNLIVLRSFGKFFGLAGLRLGFVIAPTAVVPELRRMLGDWPVSGTAIAIGTAAYADRGWQVTQRERLVASATRLDALLVGVGLIVIGGTALFRLIHAPDAAALFTHLARHRILTRPFADRPHQLRISLPDTEADWARLAAALDRMPT